MMTFMNLHSKLHSTFSILEKHTLYFTFAGNILHHRYITLWHLIKQTFPQALCNYSFPHWILFTSFTVFNNENAYVEYVHMYKGIFQYWPEYTLLNIKVSKVGLSQWTILGSPKESFSFFLSVKNFFNRTFFHKITFCAMKCFMEL